MRLRSCFVLVLVLSFVAMSACAPKPVVEAPRPEVKIGAVYPLTGALAPTGNDIKCGVELALEIINNKYSDLNLPLAADEGIPGLGGAKLVAVFGDHQGSPEKGMGETERLITAEKVVAVLGSYNSNVTATCSQAAERLGVPFVNGDSTSPMLTQRDFEWFFRVTPDDDIFSKNFFDFLDELKTRDIEVKTVSLLYENTLWGSDVGKLEKKYADERGYKVAADITYSAKATSVVSEVQTLKKANADVILQTSYTSDAIIYTQTFEELDLNPKAILAMDAGHIDSAYLQTVGAKGEYILSREVWALDFSAAKPMVGKVNDMFRQRYNMDMNGNSARAFTGVFVLADALNRAKSTKPEDIRTALKATDIPADKLIMPWEGIKFDAVGQNVKGNGIIVQVQGGKYWTVWPFNLAAKELIWPMPTWSER